MATDVRLGAQPRQLAHTRDTTFDLRLAGGMFVVVGAGFLTSIMLAASMVAGYDYQAAAISDLGVFRDTAILFNTTLVAIGALNAAGGYLYYRSHRRRLVLVPFALAGLGAIGAGLFPLSTGDAHAIFALIAFVFFNLEAIAVAFVTQGPMRVLSALAGVVGAVYVVIMVIGDGGNPAVFGVIGHGGSERMIAYPAMLWIIALGGYLLGVSPADEA